MSEFRIFCIGGFVGVGLIAVLSDNGLAKLLSGNAWEQTTALILLFGCLAVMCFGKRRAA